MTVLELFGYLLVFLSFIIIINLSSKYKAVLIESMLEAKNE